MRPQDRDRKIEDSLLKPVLQPSRGIWIFAAVLLAVMAFGGYQWLLQLRDGLGRAGMNRPVYW